MHGDGTAVGQYHGGRAEDKHRRQGEEYNSDGESPNNSADLGCSGASGSADAVDSEDERLDPGHREYAGHAEQEDGVLGHVQMLRVGGERGEAETYGESVGKVPSDGARGVGAVQVELVLFVLGDGEYELLVFVEGIDIVREEEMVFFVENKSDDFYGQKSGIGIIFTCEELWGLNDLTS